LCVAGEGAAVDVYNDDVVAVETELLAPDKVDLPEDDDGRADEEEGNDEL